MSSSSSTAPPPRAASRAIVAQAWREIKQHMHVCMSEHARERTITPLSQCAVLHIAHTHARTTIKHIATFLGITSSAATQLVSELETQNLLKKEPNPKDSRSVLIRPTLSGKRTLTKTEAVFDKEFDTLLTPLTDKELAEYARLTKKIAATFYEK